MDLEALKCSVCLHDYDQLEHLPRIIIDCGDTLCSLCLSKMIQSSKLLQCPIDNKPLSIQQPTIDNFPVNTALRLILEERGKVELCKVHKEKLRLVCLTDKCKVCDDCVHFGQHKGHKVKNMTEFKEEAYEKYNKVKEALERLNKYQKDIDVLLEDKKTSFLETIESDFKDLRDVLDSKEFELICQVNTFFKKEKEKATQGLSMDSTLGREIVHTLENQRENLKEQNYFVIIEEDTSSIISKLDPESLEQNLLEVNAGTKRLLESIDQPLMTQIRTFSQLNFPMKEIFEKIHSAFLGDGRRKRGPAGKSAGKNSQLLEFQSNFDISFEGELLKISAVDKGQQDIEVNPKDSGKEIVINPKDLEKTEQVEIKLGNYDLLLHEDIGALRYICGKLDNVATHDIEFDQDGISDHHFHKLISMILSKAEDLEEIEIKLSGCNISDKSIVYLSDKYLSMMTSLKTLNLILSWTGITNKSLQALAENVFPSLTELTSLKMSLDNTQVTDEGLVKLFKSLKEIKSFSMQLDNTELTDLSLKAFSESTMRIIDYFHHFELGLGSTKVSDKGIIDLLIQMPNVKTLSLSLNSTCVTDKTVDVFLQTAYANFDSLQTFNISLDGTQVTQRKRERIAEIAAEIATKGKISLELKDLEPEEDHINEESD